jgi:hypothetical protein
MKFHQRMEPLGSTNRIARVIMVKSIEEEVTIATLAAWAKFGELTPVSFWRP